MKSSLAAAVVAVVLGSAGAQASAAGRCPRIELAGVLAAPAPHARKVSLRAAGAVLLARRDLVGPTDVAKAYVNVTEGQTVLNLSFKADAAARVRAYTASHVGGEIALLLDNRPLRTMKVLDPIKGDGILIGPVDRAEAEALAQRINTCAGRR